MLFIKSWVSSHTALVSPVIGNCICSPTGCAGREVGAE